MSGEDFQEEAVLAAVKPLKASESAASDDKKSFGAGSNSAAYLSVENRADFARAGSETIELLFQQHHERVFRAAQRVTGSAADAEDVLQTVFLRLVRSQETQGQETRAAHAAEWSENPAAYLSRAAINASLDLLRKRKRSKAVAMDDVEHSAAVTASASMRSRNSGRSPEKHQEDRELRNLIREAVSRLGEKAGAMFALRYFEGYDNGEIATIMGTSALVVGVTLHRARARLRTEIGRYLQRHPD